MHFVFGHNRCQVLNSTHSGYYAIENAGQLYWFAYKVNNENATYGSANAVLTADIDINPDTVLNTDGTYNGTAPKDWTPIGGYYNSNLVNYSGIFDGNSKTISGLYYNVTSNENNVLVGLFGRNCGTKNVGGVCGQNSVLDSDNKVTIKNCYNEGKVSGTYFVGGVCGNNGDSVFSNVSVIENCYNTGAVSGTSCVGGVIGSNDNSELNNCYYLAGCNADGTTFTSTKGTSKTADEFKSGEVCYLLNGSSSESPIWYQLLETETYPNLDSTNSENRTVYASAPCPSKFSNDQDSLAAVAHIFEMDGDENHKCKNCGLVTVHSTEPLTYTADEATDKITVKCGDDCGKEYGIVTLSAPSENLTYDGNAKTATADTSGVTGVTISEPAITYKQGGNTLSSAPKDAGTYTASITLGTGEGGERYRQCHGKSRELGSDSYRRGWQDRENAG